jgi:hypothetical protein
MNINWLMVAEKVYDVVSSFKEALRLATETQGVDKPWSSIPDCAKEMLAKKCQHFFEDPGQSKSKMDLVFNATILLILERMYDNNAQPK